MQAMMSHMKRTKGIRQRALVSMLAAILLSDCMPSGDEYDTDLRDLERWQALVWQEHRMKSEAPGTLGSKTLQSEQNFKKTAPQRIATTRDPFSLLSQSGTQFGSKRLVKNTPAITSDPSDAPIMHLLGRVDHGGKIHALIEADKRVHCVAVKAPLPSYPITVVRIADNAVEDVVLQSKGLASCRIGRVLWIELARRQQLEQTVAAARVQQETLQGALFQLNYQKVETL